MIYIVHCIPQEPRICIHVLHIGSFAQAIPNALHTQCGRCRISSTIGANPNSRIYRAKCNEIKVQSKSKRVDIIYERAELSSRRYHIYYIDLAGTWILISHEASLRIPSAAHPRSTLASLRLMDASAWHRLPMYHQDAGKLTHTWAHIMRHLLGYMAFSLADDVTIKKRLLELCCHRCSSQNTSRVTSAEAKCTSPPKPGRHESGLSKHSLGLMHLLYRWHEQFTLP